MSAGTFLGDTSSLTCSVNLICFKLNYLRPADDLARYGILPGSATWLCDGAIPARERTEVYSAMRQQNSSISHVVLAQHNSAVWASCRLLTIVNFSQPAH
jgi:hypothetical protein